MARDHIWFEIPPGTRRSVCRGCDEVGFWVKTRNDKNMLVDLQTDGAHEPTNTEPGRGTAHFAVCPKADSFRSAR
jgi:hypothetical protein